MASWVCLSPVRRLIQRLPISFVDYILRPEIAAQCFNYIGYYCTNQAADDLVDPNLVVPDTVTSGEIVQNVSQEAEEQYNKNWDGVQGCLRLRDKGDKVWK